MKLRTLASFDVHREGLSWPWIAFDASAARIAFASSESTFATRKLTEAGVEAGPSFTVPNGTSLADVRGFSLCSLGEFALVTGTHVHLMHEDTTRTVALATLLPEDASLEPRAALFTRSGTELWISAETKDATVLLVVDVAKLTLLGVSRSAAFPPPASHELYLHPQDDAVLLLAACGEEGTFARVVGFTGGAIEPVPTALDGGGIAAGFVGFSADGARVHLAESDELRTHAWPGLLELSSVELADDFIGAYSGAVMHGRVLVDGHEGEENGGSDAVMSFDVSATLGSWLLPPFPEGMWAGILGSTCLVTVQPKGNPAHGSVIRVEDL